MFNTGLATRLGIQREVIYLFSAIKQIRPFIERKIKVYYVKNRTKFFCIGNNKTGTTSVEAAFVELGYVVGNQRQAELISMDYFDNNFSSIIEYCKTAEVFQDVPFSWPNTYKYLDAAFPNSKFILTIRDTPEQWYNSLVTFHAKKFGKGAVPTADDLKKAKYVYEGWEWDVMSKLYSLSENEDVYQKEKLVSKYTKHNQDVIDYFKNREKDLLVINLSDKGSYKRLCDFIGKKPKRETFRWENKTENLPVK